MHWLEIPWHTRKSHVQEFHDHLNSINPNIQFTIETESNNSLAFLDTKTTRKNARIAEASKAGIAEAKEAGITKGEIQTKEAQLAQAKLKWRAELPKHRAMAEHVKKEKFDSEDEEDLVAGLYTECGFDMHATYARLFFL